MKLPGNELIVADIAGDQARLFVLRPSVEPDLIRLGFAPSGDQWIRDILDDADRKFITKKLVSLDALFSAGHDWSPAELVSYFYEQGVFTGSYREIKWRAPDLYEIIQH